MFVQRPNNGLQDLKVRQAINHAINRDAILQTVLKGQTKVLNGQTVGPDAFGYNPELKPYPYDLERARTLLREAGYANGLEIDFEVGNITMGAKSKEIAEAVQQQLNQAGIRANLRVVEFGVFLSNLQTDKLQGMTVFSNFYNTTWDADHALRVVSTKGSSIIYRDPKIDEFFVAERAEVDQTKRKKILQDGLAYAAQVASAAPLFLGFGVYAANAKLQGFAPTPDRVVHLERAYFAP
jgi:peptide/nickel transport system substrate-binding protein